MCGIVGKYNLQKSVTKRELKQMASVISHRGPDDEGYWTHENIGLAQKRLAIIDLSKKGHQPMSDVHKKVWITFNGEIYNYREIREKLLKKGYRFNSASDTEVIINAYIEWGTDCLQQFRGMFAFVLFDLNTNTLFAARDRLGKKPLKYYFNGKTFIFASEIKALLTQKEITKQIDIEAIEEYLYWGFIPSPKTGYKNIFKLPPGNSLVLKNKKLTIKPYWHLTFKTNTKKSEQDFIKEIRQTLEESVRLRLISDVPIGAFLSGGIDSAIIVGLMSKLSPTKIKTYTIGFDGWDGNESSSAKITAKFHNTNHHEFRIKPNITKVLPKIIAAYDEPFGDVSAIPSYYVSREAKKHVTVVLNGDGGDENFIGYSNYELFFLIEKLRFLSTSARTVKPLVKVLSPFFYKNPLFQRVMRTSDIVGASRINSYSKYARGYVNLINFSELFKNNEVTEEKFLNRFIRDENYSINDILKMDLSNILPDGLMTKIDIASMQHGIESRAPLLDHKFVELAATIPSEMKYKDKTTKYIFKQTFADLIPPQILKLPKKGFVMPVNKWIKRELKTVIEKELLDKNNWIYNVVNFEYVKKILTLHQKTSMDYSPLIWKLFILSLWQKHYFEQ